MFRYFKCKIRGEKLQSLNEKWGVEKFGIIICINWIVLLIRASKIWESWERSTQIKEYYEWRKKRKRKINWREFIAQVEGNNIFKNYISI